MLFNAVSFNVGARDRMAIVGANGAGKTTLFEIIRRNINPDTGQLSMRQGIIIGCLQQESSSSSAQCLLDAVINASNDAAGLKHAIDVIQLELA